MPLTISDELLQKSGLTEGEARIEVACRLFDAGKLTLWAGAQWAGLSRIEFEAELRRRSIPIYRPSLTDLADDLEAIKHLRDKP